MEEIIEKCDESSSTSKCNPQDIFGKSKLSKVFDKFEKYIQPMAEHTSKYMKKVKQFPQGLETLTSALQQVQVAMKTISQSRTADVTKESFDDVIMALNDVTESVNVVKKSLSKNLEKLSTTKNAKVKKLVENMKVLKYESESLYNISKIPVLKNRLESVNALLTDCLLYTSPSPRDRG